VSVGGSMKKRGIRWQAIVLATASGLSQLVQALLYILAARQLGPGRLSDVVAPVATGMALVGLVDFGTNSLWIRRSARGALTGTELGSLITTKILAITALVAVVACVGVGFGLPVNWVIAAPILVCHLCVQSFQVPARSAGLAGYSSMVLLLSRLVGLALMGSLIGTGTDAGVALWVSLCASDVIASVFLAAFSARRLGLRLGRLVRWPWRGSVHFGLSSLAASAGGFDVGILAVVGGPTSAGIYGSVNRWVQPFNLVASSFSMTVLPAVARTGSLHAAWVVFKPLLKFTGLVFASAIALAMLAGVVVPLVLGPQFHEAVWVLRLLAIGAAFSVVSQPIIAVLQSLGHERLPSLALPLVVVLRLTAVLALGKQFGALAAGAAAVTGELLLLAALLVAAYRIWRREPPATAAAHDQ
jgi:O-antigen/teichoic acid export membrane protein